MFNKISYTAHHIAEYAEEKLVCTLEASMSY